MIAKNTTPIIGERVYVFYTMLLLFLFRKDGNIMENNKKRGPVQAVKDWWNRRTFGEQLACVCGIWCLDGILWGAAITSAVKDKKAVKIANYAYSEGLKDGKLNAYKDIVMEAYEKTQNNNH